jgi:hypothetical protein
MVFTTGYSGNVVPAEYAHIPRCEKPTQMGRWQMSLKNNWSRKPADHHLSPWERGVPELCAGQSCFRRDIGGRPRSLLSLSEETTNQARRRFPPLPREKAHVPCNMPSTVR